MTLTFNPNRCPFCNSNDIESENMEQSGNDIIDFCTCNFCHRDFSFTYTHDGKAYGADGDMIDESDLLDEEDLNEDES